MIDGTMVIDFHGHTGRIDSSGMVDNHALMLRAMDAVGIDRACVFNCFHPAGRQGHDELARFVARHPDRFIGFAYASPLWPSGMMDELIRAIDDLGFLGIKLYPPSGPCPLNGAAWDPIYEFADLRGLPIIFHTEDGPNSHPRLLGDVAPRFPHAEFVAGHSGNEAEARAAGIDVAKRCPNVYLETSSSFRTPGVVEQLVNEVGAHRVLYGSDQPLMDPRGQIGKIITADISETAKRLVLGGNARRLLGI